MSKYKAYRDRIRQDPIKRAEYRRKERERKRMYRDRKADVPPPCPATVPRPCTATCPATCIASMYRDCPATCPATEHERTMAREAEIRSRSEPAYERLRGAPSELFPEKSSGGKHASVPHSPAKSSVESIISEWHEVWGVNE